LEINIVTVQTHDLFAPQRKTKQQADDCVIAAGLGAFCSSTASRGWYSLFTRFL